MDAGSREGGRDAEQGPLCKGRSLYLKLAQAVACTPQLDTQGQRGRAEAEVACVGLTGISQDSAFCLWRLNTLHNS